MKRETRISKKIRDGMLRDFGTILHKNHGGPFGETGAADLYGTLPNGRAIYIETKTDKTKNKNSARARYQKAWLLREAKLGAVTVFGPSSYEEVLLAVRGATGLMPRLRVTTCPLDKTVLPPWYP